MNLPRLRFITLVTLITLLGTSPACALIEVSKGNKPVDDNQKWPAGSVDVANQTSRLGFWVGPPLGGGEYHFEYRGDTAAFQEALDLFAKIDAPELRLIVHEGPGSSFVLKGERDKDQGAARCDWTFVVWNPASYDRLYNDPKSVWEADDPSGNFRQPVAAPRIDVYVSDPRSGDGVDWSRVQVPKNVKVTDERASANGYPAGAGSVLRGRVTDMLTNKPVVGTKVLVMRYDNESRTYEDVISATSGTDGKYEATGVPPGSYRLHAESHGYVSRLIGYASFGNDTLKDYPAVMVAPPAMLTGTVKTFDGKPLSDVKVRAGSVIGPDGRGYILPSDAETRTDASGAFALRLPKGSCQLHATRKDFYRLDSLKIHTVPADNVALVMTVTGNLHGKVVQRGGAPTDAEYLAKLTPEGGDKVGSWGGSATVKADGSFEFDNVPPGRYTVTAKPNPGPVINGKDPSAKDVEIKPGETVHVEISVK